MNVDEAFTLGAVRVRVQRREPVRSIALDREDRMHDDARPQAALIELGQHRVDQERHVVIDDLDQADRLQIAR